MELRTLDDATVERLVRHWETGWNDRDLDTIMAPFAPQIVFSSPGVALMTGDAARTTIVGSDALRAYLEDALRRSPARLSYTLQATYVGTDSVVIVYRCDLPDGTQKAGADSMRVDDHDQVVEWRCHY